MRTLCLAVVAAAACSSPRTAGNTADAGVTIDAAVDAPDLAMSTMYSDFPPDPILDPIGLPPAGAPGWFGPAGTGAPSGGPCLIDPQIGSLFPQNWLRPRFHFVAPAGQNLFEIRLHVDNQANDLVVYTTATTWT